MAEEIYREWFVRMRFPGAEKRKFKAGYPADWKPTRVGALIRRLPYGRIYHERDTMLEGATKVIDQSQDDILGFHDSLPDHQATKNRPILIFGDHTCKTRLMIESFSVAENVIPFVPQDHLNAYFVYHLVKDLMLTREYKRHWTDLTVKETLRPEDALCEKFSIAVRDLNEKADVIRRSTAVAAKTRNALVPRLISGKLRVDHLDIQLPPSMRAEQAERAQHTT